MKKLLVVAGLLLLTNVSVANADVELFDSNQLSQSSEVQQNQPQVKVTKADDQKLQIEIDLPAACSYRCEIKDDMTGKTLKTFNKKYSEQERKTFTEFYSYKSNKNDTLHYTVETTFDLKSTETPYNTDRLEGNGEKIMKIYSVLIDQKNNRVLVRKIR